MPDNFATISFRANLLPRCEQYAENAKQIIGRWKELKEATAPLSLKPELAKLLQSARLSGLVTAVETLLNDTLTDVLVAYPPKLGKKQITVQELNDSGSYVAMIQRIARKTVNDLSYMTPRDFLDEWQKQVGQVQEISEDQILEFSEVKATRDIYVHSNGVPNEIYERKAGTKARKPSRGTLSLDEPYITAASELCESLVKALSAQIASKYAACTKEKLFREMWDATCCGRLVSFDKQWELSSRPHHRKDFKWGWSTSEKAVYDVFLRIFHSQSPDITEDIHIALHRWPADTNEGAIIRSWIEYPFYL